MPSRRDFLAFAARNAAVLGGAGFVASCPWLTRSSGLFDPVELLAVPSLLASAPRARYWATAATAGIDCRTCHPPEVAAKDRAHKHNPTTVRCLLCAQSCTIENGKRGRCRARANVDGELRSLVYGRPTAVHVDPIEKKPFYHFLPGTAAYSFGTSGCPLRCRFCQNWEISQASPEDFDATFVPATAMVAEAASRRAPVVAFTYNEPTVSAEYVVDVASEARRRGLKSVMVSCGFMNPAPLADFCRVLDAIKIDLKGFTESFYRDVCGASLAPVQRGLVQIRKAGVHLEIVNLVVPTLNDAESSLRSLSQWVVAELGPDVPVHFTRFHPDYQLMNLAPTPVPTLERARAIAMAAGIRYAYVGNVPGHPGNNTYCPACRRAVITRTNFFVTEQHITAGRCAFCGQTIAGVWG